MRAERAGSGSAGFVPCIDLAAVVDGDLESPAARRTLERVRSACSEVGFLVVTGHGVPDAILADCREAASEFFALPASEKLRAAPRRWNPSSPNVYRGFFPSSVHGKEGLDLGDPRLRPEMRELLARPYFELNRLPTALGPSWHDRVARYFDALFRFGRRLLEIMVASLGGDPRRAREAFVRPGSCSTLRFNFYPGLAEPVEISKEDGAALACETHADSGLLTILQQCDRSGLQVRDRARRWHDVPPARDAFVANTGRAFQRITGGAFGATRHRVLHAPEPRLSVPFFLEPVPDLVLEPGSFGLDLPATSAPVSYQAFLGQSLRAFAEYAR